MRLICKKGIYAHWGSIISEGLEYDLTPYTPSKFESKTLELITNYVEYMDAIKLISISATYVRNGYTPENIKEIMPLYKTMEEVRELYVKEIVVDYVVANTDDKSGQSFILNGKGELMNLHNVNELHFRTTVYFVEDYFDYTKIRRDDKLNKLGI